MRASQPSLSLHTKPKQPAPIASESDMGAANTESLSDIARGILTALQRNCGWISKSALAHERECRGSNFYERACALKLLIEKRLIRVIKRPIGSSMRSTTWYCKNTNDQLIPDAQLRAEEMVRRDELNALNAYVKQYTKEPKHE